MSATRGVNWVRWAFPGLGDLSLDPQFIHQHSIVILVAEIVWILNLHYSLSFFTFVFWIKTTLTRHTTKPLASHLNCQSAGGSGDSAHLGFLVKDTPTTTVCASQTFASHQWQLTRPIPLIKEIKCSFISEFNHEHCAASQLWTLASWLAA